MIILAIVLLLFGTKRLRNIGADLGNAVKGFRGAMGSGDKEKEGEPQQLTQADEKKGDEAMKAGVDSRKEEKT